MDARRIRDGTGIATAIRSWKARAIAEGAGVQFITPDDVRDRSPWPSEPHVIREATTRAGAQLFHSTYPHTLLPSGVPVLFSLFDTIQLTRSFPRQLIARSLIGRNIRLARGVLTISNSARASIAHEFEVDPNLIHVVPCGVDLPPKNLTGAPEPYVLYVGNCKPHKHVGQLIEWSGRVLPDVGLRLVLVVPSDCKDGLVKALPAGVTIAANVSDEELARLRSRATFAVSLGRDEGFGLPPLEAAAYGVPSVLLDAGAHREVMQDGATYCTLDRESFRAAVGNAVTDRAKLGEQARRRAEQLTWDNSWTSLKRVYTALLAGQLQ